MAPTVAVAHYPEGAGHATRMLAVADAVEERGGTVRMAGGGAGTQFVALNGYDEFEPTNVDFIDTYQGGSTWATLSRSLPASLSRIAEYQAWLTATQPDALVTDDMFAAMAASRCDVPLYVLKHDMPSLYHDRIERAGAGFHTLFQLSAAREFFYPVVWPESGGDPEAATRIPPVALDGDEVVDDAPDVVVVPSHYSSLSRIADHLRRQGYDVLDVADDEWDPVPSLLPYVRGADVVVCSGYSTIMDAAVAGTPCVVHPETDEQRAVADWLERFDVDGFAVADRPIDVLDAVADPPAEPAFENGAEVIATRVLTDLRDPDPYAESEDATVSADEPVTTAGGLRSLVAVPTLAAVAATTAATTVAPARIGRGIGERLARLASLAGGVGGRLGSAGARAGAGLRHGSSAAGRRVQQVATESSHVATVAGWTAADAATSTCSTVAGGTRKLGSGIRRALDGAAGALESAGRGLAERVRVPSVSGVRQ
ncbi:MULTISPECIES: glycosyltransferase [Halolamina]|uniref:UDP:flavonoid glycosyltransferase YjiC, YdhE family n=1 Tax=Halolamina pelagica TaxID=699431 RepID=A0A1I5NYW0_9EURY|nr:MULTISPECIES: hypothetical protein [Halolamina]SFP26927.1 UDP:flavonoid glycosyltransferase YjiC, YdhE family [Halolamina pelagica]